MLEYLSYGAIGIAMATTILAFRLLSSEQKKEHPNDSILKMIKWFMVLSVFFALFFGVVELINGGDDAEPNTIPETISNLKAQSTALLLERDDEGDISVKMKDTSGVEHELGALSNRNFGIVKEKTAKNAWHVNLGNAKLGQINTAWNLWNHRSDDNTHAYLNQWYAIDRANSKLVFMIESIKLADNSDQNQGKYEFTVRFSELDANGKNGSISDPFSVYSTQDGAIDPFRFIPLNRSDWNNEYYAGMGFGQPTKQSKTSMVPEGTPIDGVSWNRVQRYNGSVIQMNLKNK